MAGAVYDLYMNQGDDFSQTMDMNLDATRYGIEAKAIDSTGTSITMGVVWASEARGTFTITVDSTNTTLMSSGVGKYNIEIEDRNLKKSKLMKGNIYVSAEVL